MGKQPAFQFYPGDWTRDLDDQDLEVEGAWIRICCRLWWSEKPGEATKSLKEWARILRKSEKKTLEILKKLIDGGIADGDVSLKGKVIVVCRRMVKDASLRDLRKEAGSLGGNPKLTELYNKPGYVYVVRRADNGNVKIGIALNPTNRINKLRYKEKVGLEVVCSQYVDDMGKEEKRLHEKYIEQRVIGEWFLLDDSQIKDIADTLKGKGGQNPTPSSSSSSSSSIKEKESEEKEKEPASPEHFVLTSEENGPEAKAVEETRPQPMGFDCPDGFERIENEGLLRWITEACAKLVIGPPVVKSKFPECYALVNKLISKQCKVEGIERALHHLMVLQVNKPWPYAMRIATSVSRKIREEEHIAQDKAFKREVQQMTKESSSGQEKNTY